MKKKYVAASILALSFTLAGPEAVGASMKSPFAYGEAPAAAGLAGAQPGPEVLGAVVGRAGSGDHVAANDLVQVSTGRASLVGGPGVLGGMSNTFGDLTFSGQMMSQNNIAAGVNIAQQGAVSVFMSSDSAEASSGLGLPLSMVAD